MCPSRKRVRSKNDEGENVRAESSYAKMKVKMEKYEFELEQLITNGVVGGKKTKSRG